jgi:RNA polymerase sigma factor (sigma-70 family)
MSVTDHELMEVVRASAGVIRSMLAPTGLVSDVEDVLQETWISVSKARHTYDPSQGEIRSWVNTIARRRATDHLRKLTRHQAVQNAVEFTAQRPSLGPFNVVEASFADAVDGRLDGMGRIGRVLRMTREAMGGSAAFDRTMRLILFEDEDVAATARKLGVSEAAVRDSRRETIRVAHVVDRSLQKRQSTQRPTMRDLLECLPQETDGQGSWAQTMGRAIARAGSFQAVNVATIQQITGWSYNTARQYMTETSWLMSLARTVIVAGEVSVDTTTAEGTEQ